MAISEIDADKLVQFASRAVDEVGATLNAALVVIGDRLGLYRALAGDAGLSPAELADRCGATERYVREWLNAQAAGGYVDYDPDTGRYTLPPEQTVALTDPDNPAFLPGLFQLAVGAVGEAPSVLAGARSGRHAHAREIHEGRERFLRSQCGAHLVEHWLPALDGVVEKLQRGGRVADVGCGRGASTLLMAQAFPRATFDGSDDDADSIATARRRADAAGMQGRVRFHAEAAATYRGARYDLVTMLYRLHELGDPAGAARHVRRTLAPDGTWMIVEPRAGDRVEDNLNPVGRAYYALSTLLCTPASVSQEAGSALGAQAGEARIREVAEAAGFARFRRVAESPLLLVFEARP